MGQTNGKALEPLRLQGFLVKLGFRPDAFPGGKSGQRPAALLRRTSVLGLWSKTLAQAEFISPSMEITEGWSRPFALVDGYGFSVPRQRKNALERGKRCYPHSPKHACIIRQRWYIKLKGE